MSTEKPQRVEKATGYSLLGIGLFLVILPTIIALFMLLTAAQIPQLVPAITVSEDLTVDQLAESIVTLADVLLVLMILAVAVWAGSIISSRGVTMIKDVRLKLVSRSLKQSAETARKVEEA